MARGDLRAKIRLEGDASSANAAIKSTETRFQKFGASIKRNALALGASLAAVAGAFRLVKTSAEQAGQAKAFETSLAAQGIAADKFLAKLKEVSAGQIANADLILASNRALALGIKADDLPALLETASQASVKLGVSVTQAFNDITTGVGRASPLILDNLGIVVDSNKVYGDYAASIGKTVEALSKQERTQALTNAVIRDGLDATKSFTDSQDAMTVAINTSAAALENFKASTGTVLSGLVQLAAAGLTTTARAFLGAAEAGTKFAEVQVWLLSLIPGFGKAAEDAAVRLQRFDDELDLAQEKVTATASALFEGGLATVKFGLGLSEAGNKARIAAPAIDGVADATNNVTESTDKASVAQAQFKARLDEAFAASKQLTESVNTTNVALKEQQTQATSTAEAIVYLTAVDRELAIQQARRELRERQARERTIASRNAGRGGPYSGTDDYNLSEFGTGGRVRVDDDGDLRFS